ncbi:MAG TPA: hypothetical protein VER98_12075 [Terriglobia bacterium]|nr:hypothetical protein [Terriglobia bacterium]
MKALHKFASYALLIFAAGPLRAQIPSAPQPAPSVQEILDRMLARNAVQDRTLLEFHALRKFYAANFRFKTDSTMYVQTVFRRPDQLQSTVTSHEGSNLIRSRVFDKILEAENETHARKDKQQVDIIPANYNFELVGTEDCNRRSCYHMLISPKRRDKYSLDGEVWIDAEDYSIVRIHGAPARRPSIWTLKTEIDRRYKKVDSVWLPERMDSSSNIMIAGHSVLSIEYTYNSVKTER